MYRFWHRAFTSGRDPRDIGLARILFYSYLFYYFFLADNYIAQFLALGGLGESLWLPVSFFQFFGPTSTELLFSPWFLWIFAAGLIFSALGLFFPISAGITFLSGLVVIGMPNNFGTIYDSTTLVCVVLGILPFTRASQYYSLDSKLDLIKDKSDASSIWGLNFISIMVFLFYFTSGIQKVRLGGWDYYFTHNLSMALVFNESPVGKDLATIPWLEKAMKVSGVFFQLSAIIAILNRKLRPLFAIFYLSFHVIVDFTMQVHFNIFKIIFVYIFPWHEFRSDIFKLLKKTVYEKFKVSGQEMIGPIRKGLTLAILCISIISVTTFIHFWPFSTTTMYAYSEDYPYDEYNFYARFKGKDNYELLLDPSYFPIDRKKTQLLIRKQVREYRNTEVMTSDIFDMLKKNHKELEALEVRRCFYYSLEDLIEYYPISPSCELITRYLSSNEADL